MTKEENKAIEDLKDILKYWQTIVEIEDDVEREIEMNCYSEEMPFEQLKIALNLIEKLQKENEKLKNKVIIRDNDIIYLEETAEKEFITKQEIKENYIPKDKIREIIEELEKQEDWYIENKSLDDLYGKIDILKELLEEG